MSDDNDNDDHDLSGHLGGRRDTSFPPARAKASQRQRVYIVSSVSERQSPAGFD